jgi:hypothetical protein
VILTSIRDSSVWISILIVSPTLSKISNTKNIIWHYLHPKLLTKDCIMDHFALIIWYSYDRGTHKFIKELIRLPKKSLESSQRLKVNHFPHCACLFEMNIQRIGGSEEYNGWSCRSINNFSLSTAWESALLVLYVLQSILFSI